MNKRIIFSILIIISMMSVAAYTIPDPGHAAVEIGGGFFYEEGYTFPRDVNVSQDFRVNGTLLNVNTSSGNVGIGTANPGVTLDVNGFIRSNSGIRSDSFTTQGGVSMLTATGTSLRLGTTSYYANISLEPGNVSRLVVTNEGRVGINRTNPAYTLDITGDLRTTGAKSGFLADVAESVSPTTLERGDLVSISFEEVVELLPGGNIPVFKVTKTTTENGQDFVGIVYQKLKNDGDYVGSPGGDILTGDRMLIATQNSVSFLKVSAENGPIVPGDYLTPSSTPGHAMKADESATIIVGRALNTVTSGTSTISAFVQVNVKEGLTNINDVRLSTQDELPTSVTSLGIEQKTPEEVEVQKGEYAGPVDPQNVTQIQNQIDLLQLQIDNINATPINVTTNVTINVSEIELQIEALKHELELIKTVPINVSNSSQILQTDTGITVVLK